MLKDILVKILIVLGICATKRMQAFLEDELITGLQVCSCLPVIDDGAKIGNSAGRVLSRDPNQLREPVISSAVPRVILVMMNSAVITLN